MRHFAILVLLLTSCVDQRYFAPRENQNGTGPAGEPAAVYGVPGGAEGGGGEVRLWSAGSRGRDEGGGHTVLVHVGFELENTGTAALELADLQCEELWVDRERHTTLLPFRLEGPLAAKPGTTSRVDAWFVAPGAESARQVDGFSVRYSILFDGAPVLVQVTPFAPYIRPDPRDYDPWFFGPHRHSGFGLGLGLGWYCR